jgi:hypothetical protein
MINPMPLKHPTETILICVLGLAILITGIVVSLLPRLPEGTVIWGIAWALSIAYPLLFYPLFKERRADYLFRLLHFIPSGLLLLWLVLELAVFYEPRVEIAMEWYTRGWALIPVSVSFFMIAYFCAQVIRQQTRRIILLLVLLVPYATVGASADMFNIHDHLVTSVDAIKEWSDVLKIKHVASLIQEKEKVQDEDKGDDKNLYASADEEEELWRMRLRRMERREDRLGSSSSEREENPPPSPEEVLVAADRDDPTLKYGDEKPPELTSSGPLGIEFAGILMLAGWCSSVHRRARKRACSV